LLGADRQSRAQAGRGRALTERDIPIRIVGTILLSMIPIGLLSCVRQSRANRCAGPHHRAQHHLRWLPVSIAAVCGYMAD
jgi:hypothetical protein